MVSTVTRNLTGVVNGHPSSFWRDVSRSPIFVLRFACPRPKRSQSILTVLITRKKKKCKNKTCTFNRSYEQYVVIPVFPQQLL